MKKWLLLLMVWVSLTGCLPTPSGSTATPRLATTTPELPATEIVESVLTAKLAAMAGGNVEQYLALIDATDPEYYTEQRNWFLAYQDAETSDFTIEVLKATYHSDRLIVASLYQHYLYGPEKTDRTVTYEERFIQTAQGWQEADLNFQAVGTEHFVIKYLVGLEAKAKAVGAEAEEAYVSVTQELGLSPPATVTLKLFDTRELLRENTDIRVAYLFNGWAEDGESIKLYGRRLRGTTTPLVAHELTHKITLGISDSLCSWFAEGLATYFGNQPLRGGNALQRRTFTSQELARPITWLEENNLTQMTEDAELYYAVSAMVVEFMVQTYGRDQVHALLYELARYPRYNRGHDYAGMELESQQRLHQALETVLGVDPATLNEQWLAWIAVQQP